MKFHLTSSLRGSLSPPCFTKFCTFPPAFGSSNVCMCVCQWGLFRVGPELAAHIGISCVFTKLKPPKEKHERNSSKERAEYFRDTKELFQRVQFQWSMFYFDDTSLSLILSQIYILKFTSNRAWESTGQKISKGWTVSWIHLPSVT